ncbi:MAG TPA: DUF2268 domain-containing putative Zn-dependent protease [Herpetosiphonaceae bacterium]|nr:DUF2268 domain-containing putative Zn-dependent protease [Herpetosiphonaceae bacterium]
MKINWIPTDEFYRRLLAEPDDAARRQLYLDLLVEPWRPMMQMMGRQAGAAPPDPLDGARAWAWLLPDQTARIADLLGRMEAADAWGRGAAALALAAERFAPFAGRIPFDEVTGWLVLADPDRSNPLERGYTGATDWLSPRLIGQFWEPDAANLARLPGLLAHETHHLIRRAVVPWDMRTASVADYIVLEGTAESFAVALFGEIVLGAYVSEVGPADLEAARRLIGPGLGRTGFDAIRAYVFGDALAERGGFAPLGGMPTYGGYAVGYHVVQAFLARSGRSIEEATFLPAAEIVAGSGFFNEPDPV